jgi:alkanesulfonate monooxygenase SsuD/methylene tetrahydromethanopterin reductase-like flavin-dependent oxidoreductase (luciferase family)
VYVAESEEQAMKDVKKSLTWVIDMLQLRGTLSEGSDVLRSLDDWRKERTQMPPTLEYIAENRSIIGDPAQCAAKIKELQAQGIEYFGCNFAFGGLAHDKVKRSMELFAGEVMPHFR